MQLYYDAYYGSLGYTGNSGRLLNDFHNLTTHMSQEISQYGDQSLGKSNSAVLNDGNVFYQDLKTCFDFMYANNGFASMSNATFLAEELGFPSPFGPQDLASASSQTAASSSSQDSLNPNYLGANADTAQFGTYPAYSDAVSPDSSAAQFEVFGT